MIKLLIADDHDVVVQGISRILGEFDDIEVVGVAETGEEAVRLAKQLQPDVLLMDVRMPGIGGLEATRQALKAGSSIRVIALTGYKDSSYPNMFLRAGASGYITKDVDMNEMANAIRAVHAGNRYLSKSVAERLISQASSPEGDEINPFNELSDRELQIGLLVVECYKSSEIAERLNLSPKTVNSYKYRVFEKLNVQSDVELTLLALRHGMIDFDS